MTDQRLESLESLRDIEGDFTDLVEVASGADARLCARDSLRLILDQLRVSASPRGLELFERLVVKEESVQSVCQAMSLSTEAVYAWRSRLLKLVRRLAVEHEIMEHLGAPPTAESAVSGKAAAQTIPIKPGDV